MTIYFRDLVIFIITNIEMIKTAQLYLIFEQICIKHKSN